MGGALGGLSDADQERIQKLLNDILAYFSTQFTIAYKNALISKVKADFETVEESKYQLEAPPEKPVVDLCAGWIWKEGAVNKSYKRRYAIAHGPVGKYTVEYFTDEANGEGKGKKGEITCRGYRVQNMSEEDMAAAGEKASFGLKLVPWNSNRRTWFIGFESEEDSKKWKGALEDCCWYAPPPKDEDELISAAFEEALSLTRYQYCYWGWWQWEMPEPEQLGDFIMQVIESNVLREIFSGIAEGAAKSAAIGAIRKFVGSLVQAGTKAAWGAARSGMVAARPTLEDGVKQAIGPLVQEQIKLKEKIVETVGGIVRPLFTMIGDKCIKPFLRFALKHISEVHIAFLRGFTEYFIEQVDSMGTEPAKHTEVLDKMMRSTDYYYWPPICAAREEINGLYKSDALDKLREVSDYRVSNDRIASTMYATMRQLGLNAVWTFKKETSVPLFDLSRRKEVARDVIAKLTNDLRQSENDIITSIVNDTLQSTCDQSIMAPALAAVEPIASLIPDFLTQFIDISELTRSAVQDIIDNDLVGASVEPLVGPEQEKLTALHVQLQETTLA